MGVLEIFDMYPVHIWTVSRRFFFGLL